MLLKSKSLVSEMNEESKNNMLDAIFSSRARKPKEEPLKTTEDVLKVTGGKGPST